jgi:Lecithin:cholesterol acyltransferase
MANSFFRNRKCWMEHLSLNFTTGLDPAGIKLRNAQGLDAVDFFFPGALLTLLSTFNCLCCASHMGRARAALHTHGRCSLRREETLTLTAFSHGGACVVGSLPVSNALSDCRLRRLGEGNRGSC